MSDIDKNKVSAAFDRAANHYDAIATFQHRVCERLAERLPAPLHPTHILDGGCGTGYGATLLQHRWPTAQLIGCDLAPEMVTKTLARGIAATVSDLEQLPFPDERFNLVWSNLALQWCTPSTVYAELHRVLQPGGMLACTSLTNGTLRELEAAFSGIDQHQHVLDFQSELTTKAALSAAGFADIRIEQETFVTRHADFPGLLETIRGIGAGQTGGNRRRSLMGKRAWHTARARYEALRDQAGMLPATYQVMFIFATKP